jgi:hypothetical protein
MATRRDSGKSCGWQRNSALVLVRPRAKHIWVTVLPPSWFEKVVRPSTLTQTPCPVSRPAWSSGRTVFEPPSFTCVAPAPVKPTRNCSPPQRSIIARMLSACDGSAGGRNRARIPGSPGACLQTWDAGARQQGSFGPAFMHEIGSKNSLRSKQLEFWGGPDP